MRKGKKKLAQMMAAVLTATTLLQTPVSAFADSIVEERVEKETHSAKDRNSISRRKRQR